MSIARFPPCNFGLALACLLADTVLLRVSSSDVGSAATDLNSISDVLKSFGEDSAIDGMLRAASWLVNVSQIKNSSCPEDVGGCKGYELYEGHWYGAFRSETASSDPTKFAAGFGMYGPVWHTGQAIKALVMTARRLKQPWYGTVQRSLLQAAKAGADFILDKQIKHGFDAGLLIALEFAPGNVSFPSTSTQLEAIDGLFELADYTKNVTLLRDALMTTQWIRDYAYIVPVDKSSHAMDGLDEKDGYNYSGLLFDVYNTTSHTWAKEGFGNVDNHKRGRPLADDSIMLKAFQRTGDVKYKHAFYATVERLLQDEAPPGNWGSYSPCSGAKGFMHARQAFWWGLPMIDAYEDSKDQRYLEAAKRSAEWYKRAQYLDGSVGAPRYDFKHKSGDATTSAASCAAIFWIRLFQITKDKSLLTPLLLALQHVRTNHYAANGVVRNPYVRGAVIETSAPWGSGMPLQSCNASGVCEATDTNPQWVRDIAASFYMQALSLLLQAAAKEEADEKQLPTNVVFA